MLKDSCIIRTSEFSWKVLGTMTTLNIYTHIVWFLCHYKSHTNIIEQWLPVTSCYLAFTYKPQY